MINDTKQPTVNSENKGFMLIDESNESMANNNITVYKAIIVTVTIMVVVTLLFGIFYAFIKKTNTNIPYLNSTSKPVYIMPNQIKDKGVNIVFVSDKYSSKDEFLKDTASLIYEMKSIEPWKSFDNFNYYKVYDTHNYCHIKTENERKPVLRCNDKINDLLLGLNLEHLKLVVLSRQDFQGWANVARLENSGIFFSLTKAITQADSKATGYLFNHLIGHAFGLKDEEKYVIAKAGGAPHTPDGPNCAPDMQTAKEWWGSIADANPSNVGFFKTCAGSDKYIKPTKSSLMNLAELDAFVPNYGAVSTLYLKKMLNYCYTKNEYSYKTDPRFFEQYPEFKNCVGK